MIISRTPFRISLFGGGTDYPTWFREHGGAVIGTAIDKYCYISVRRLPPFFEHKSKIVYSKVELVKEISRDRAPGGAWHPDRYGRDRRPRDPSRRRSAGALRIGLEQLVHGRTCSMRSMRSKPG